MKNANWIQHTHLFRADEFVYAACKKSCRKPYRTCPYCGTSMKKTKYDPSWVDEAEGMSAFFDEDW